MRYIAGLSAAIVLSGCTSLAVQPVDEDLNVRHVCIQNNPQVTIEGFTGYLQDDFKRHGITTEVFNGQRPNHCEYVLYYTARRSWDIKAFMSTAELKLRRNSDLVASADYHLKGKGGFSLTKFASTESKLDNIVDELLGERGGNPDAAVSQAHGDSVFSTNIDAELQQLEQLRAHGVITDEEFVAEKSALLSQNRD